MHSGSFEGADGLGRTGIWIGWDPVLGRANPIFWTVWDPLFGTPSDSGLGPSGTPILAKEARKISGGRHQW